MQTLKYYIHKYFKDPAPIESKTIETAKTKINSSSDDKELEEVNKTSSFEVEFLNRDTVKILTYNIFLRPIVHTNIDDHKLERMLDFLDEMIHYDIICFQEAFAFFSSRKEKLIFEAAKRGYFYYYSHPEPCFTSFFSFDGGLLIISRFKIEETKFYPYTYACDIDAIVNKGILYAKINIQGTILHLLTTHLQATYYQKTDEKMYISFLTRKTQIEEMAYYLEQCLKTYYKNSDEKILFVGDLNVPAEGSENLEFLYGKLQDEYSFLKNEINSYSLYKSINVFYNEKKKHPLTFGGTDTVLYDKNELGIYWTLDYIYELKCDLSQINKQEVKETEVKKKLEIDYSSIAVKNFKVRPEKQKDRKYTVLSDHAALTVDLKII